jgi:hypothetical protein
MPPASTFKNSAFYLQNMSQNNIRHYISTSSENINVTDDAEEDDDNDYNNNNNNNNNNNDRQ